MGIGMLLVFAGLMLHQFESMIVRHYGRKYGNGGMFFNAIICLFAMLYFFITDEGSLEFVPGIWAYGLINSTMYATGFYAGYLSMREGSFGFTKLITSFSSIIPIAYGIILLKEPTNIFTYISFVLIFLSIFIMNYKKSDRNTVNNTTPKWWFYIILTIISNALISIIGKMQVEKFEGKYRNEFLIISLAGAAISLFIMGFVFEKAKLGTTLKTGFLYGMLAGIFNGANNLLTLIIYNFLPISIVSPVRTGLGMVIGFVASVLLYKEKFSKKQILSVLIGIIAVMLINLKF